MIGFVSLTKKKNGNSLGTKTRKKNNKFGNSSPPLRITAIRMLFFLHIDTL